MRSLARWCGDMADWHLDKRFPITLVVTVLIQTGVLVWWASTVESRLAYQMAALENHETIPAHGIVDVRLATLDANQEQIAEGQREVVRALIRLDERIARFLDAVAEQQSGD